MEMQYMNIILISLASLTAIYIFLNSKVRTAKDVLLDLTDKTQEITASPKKDFELNDKLIPVASVIAGLFLRMIFGGSSNSSLILCLLFSFSAGVFYTSYQKKRRLEDYKYKINFYLPLIMERLVMAVQAGQDILPAIGSMLAIEEKEKKLDPVSELLLKVKNLSESGLSFEKSLQQVAESVDSGALRHAFIHLALAHKEGGELVAPLRELSDSTQLFFQETIEEEIAKMPVKATLPLLLIFAGLIICFITTPIIQIMDVMQRSMP
jgi:Flp pilus assembly protein TadB